MAEGTYLRDIKTAANLVEGDTALIIRATGQGRRVPVTLLGGGGGGGGGGTITKVFGRDGPEIAAEAYDYSADQIAFDPGDSGLIAENVAEAIAAIQALAGVLPTPTSESHVLGLNSSLQVTWVPQYLLSVNGRSGPVVLQAGDMDAGMITETDTAKILTAAERTKLAALNDALQCPDTSAATIGQVPTWDGADIVWGTVSGGAGLSQIDLLARAVPNATTPPTYQYVGGVACWAFSQAGSDEIRGVCRWPGGTPTLRVQHSLATATTGNVGWKLSIMALTPGDTTLVTADAFDTANTTTATAVPAAAGRLAEQTLALTNLNSAATGDWIKWKLVRDTAASGNATGLLRLHNLILTFA